MFLKIPKTFMSSLQKCKSEKAGKINLKNYLKKY